MADPLPLPPIVSGPVYTTSTQVYVNNVLPNSTVTVYNDNASTNVVGTATSTSPGSIWVPLTKPLSLGQPITARQLYTGSSIKVAGTSDPSTVPVPVLPAPDPLPSPIFASGLCTCMDSVYIDGLIPGATLTITMGGTPMVHAPVNQSPQWFELAVAAISTTSVLKAQQNIGISKSSITSSPYSIPVAGALGKPDISPVPAACQTSLHISNVTAGADIKITNVSITATGTSPSSSYEVVGLPQLQPGSLTAQQYFTRCREQGPGPTATYTVTKSAPKFPKVSYAPCADITQLEVSDVVAGEVLTLEVSYSNKTGPVLVQLGSCGVAGPGAVPLPATWYPTDAIGPVTIRIEATLCDVSLPSPGYSEIPVGQTGGPYAPPTVQAPLYDCATSVRILGAHPGSLIQVFSVLPVKPPVTIPRSNPVVATAADFAIKLWSPLSTGEAVYATQLGCNANGESPHVTVIPIPPLPVPTVPGYVLAGAKSVRVNKVVPGAQVTLLVNGEPRSLVDSIAAEVGAPAGVPPLIEVEVPAGSPPLVAGDILVPVQTLCGEIGIPAAGQGGGVTVVAPVPNPPRGLGGSTNYIMFIPTGSGGCQNLLGVSVTIDITQDLVWKSTSLPPPGACKGVTSSTPGFGFQLNCYSPKPPSVYETGWQQYVVSLQGTQLVGAINNWPPSGGPAIVTPTGAYQFNLGSALSSVAIPAGYRIKIILQNDKAGNVTGAQFVVTDNLGNTVANQTVTILSISGITAAALAPIIAFELNLVGPICAEAAVLSSGAGVITYSASSALTVANVEPACAESSDFTAETANCSYGILPANPGNPFTQSLTVTSTAPLVRPRGLPLLIRSKG